MAPRKVKGVYIVKLKDLTKFELIEYITSLETQLDKLEIAKERLNVALINCEQRETEYILENL